MKKIEDIKKEAQELISKLISEFELDVKEEDEVIYLHIKTDSEAPTIIGRHGETVRAIQKLLEVMCFKKFGEQVELLVDVNDYRERQREKIVEITERYVSKTNDTKERSWIRGFSAYERKIAHEYIVENHPELTSYSEGEGRDRMLYIDFKDKAKEASSESSGE